MADTYTKKDATELRRAVQDIELFLRLATVRIEKGAHLPMKAVYAHLVIGWLRGLAVSYAHGEDITNV